MRYLRPDPSPAIHLKRLLAGDTAPQVYTDLVFYYTAKRDGLLREFTLRRYWPAVREGRLILTNRDAEEFIREGELAGRMAQGLFITRVSGQKPGRIWASCRSSGAVIAS